MKEKFINERSSNNGREKYFLTCIKLHDIFVSSYKKRGENSSREK
nr:MAG TPA: hypothetical protein [Caudoviricetes sp.]